MTGGHTAPKRDAKGPRHILATKLQYDGAQDTQAQRPKVKTQCKGKTEMADKQTPDKPRPVTQAGADCDVDKAVAAVRALIKDNPVAPSPPTALHPLPKTAQVQDLDPPQPPCATPPPASAGGQTPLGSSAKKVATEGRETSRLLFTFTGQVLRHPMTPRVLVVLGFLTAFLLYPVMTLAMLFVVGLIGAIVYLSVGPERVEEFAARRFERLQKRDPDRADVLRKRAIRVVAILNKGIDVLPERWTSGLYLPDFEDSSIQPDKLGADPFERLGPEANAMAKAALDHDLDQALRRPSARAPRAAGKEYQYRRL